MSKFRLNLNDREWGEFNFIDIFIIRSGFYNKKPPLEPNGTIPFLGATENNNGITEFYSLENIERNSKIGYGKNEPLSQKIFDGNCICVTNNGSVGYAYYQATPFTCSHDVNPLYLKNYQLNGLIARFLISAIEKQRVCFQYSRKWRPIRMKKSKIKLPITQNGEPDYAFMEQFIKERMVEKLKQYNAYLDQQLAEHNFSGSLKEKQWGEFFIKDIFITEKSGKQIPTGAYVPKEFLKTGNTPRVTVTAQNNGVDNFWNTNHKNYRTHSNFISVSFLGDAFFHQYNASIDMKVHSLRLKDRELNSNLATFLVTQIQKNIANSCYGNQLSSTDLPHKKILLPITENGEPDYAFMENYIRNLMLKKYQKYAQLRLQEYA